MADQLILIVRSMFQDSFKGGDHNLTALISLRFCPLKQQQWVWHLRHNFDPQIEVWDYLMEWVWLTINQH